MENETDFLPTDKIESFPQVDSIFCVCIARHAQSSQNSKFAISQGKREE